jgi:PII-like signaling protein
LNIVAGVFELGVGTPKSKALALVFALSPVSPVVVVIIDDGDECNFELAELRLLLLSGMGLLRLLPLLLLLWSCC